MARLVQLKATESKFALNSAMMKKDAESKRISGIVPLKGKLLLWKKEWYQQEGHFQEKSDALATISSEEKTLSILELSDSPTVLRTVLRMTRIF